MKSYQALSIRVCKFADIDIITTSGNEYTKGNFITFNPDWLFSDGNEEGGNGQ